MVVERLRPTVFSGWIRSRLSSGSRTVGSRQRIEPEYFGGVSGLYLGRLEAKQHRDEYADIGRWANLQDKEFFAGYHEAYLGLITRLSAAGHKLRAQGRNLSALEC